MIKFKKKRKREDEARVINGVPSEKRGRDGIQNQVLRGASSDRKMSLLMRASESRRGRVQAGTGPEQGQFRVNVTI